MGDFGLTLGSLLAPLGSLLAPLGSLLAPLGSLLAPLSSLLAPLGSLFASLSMSFDAGLQYFSLHGCFLIASAPLRLVSASFWLPLPTLLLHDGLVQNGSLLGLDKTFSLTNPKLRDVYEFAQMSGKLANKSRYLLQWFLRRA